MVTRRAVSERIDSLSEVNSDVKALEGMKEIDPITAEVIRCNLVTIANEMGDTMIRTATTPTFSESHDFSTSIFDARGRIVALADALPIHMGACKFSVMAALEAFGDDLHPGDVIIVNDPYHGGSHLPDWTMMTPIFFEGRLAFFPVTRAHQGDTGGAVPGGYNPGATDIWQEGLRLPPIKIYEAGKPRNDIIKMLQINNREPTFLGDLKAMLGSVRVGERRLTEMLEKYGVWQEKSMYGKKYMGVVRTTVLIDPDGKVAEIWEKVKVKGHAETVFDKLKELQKAGAPA